MEWKIGEIKQVNGEWYQCVEGLYCDNCAFVNDNCENRERITLREKLTKQPTTGFCNSEKRNDRKSVIFKKLEKVKDPYKFQKRTIQTYKLYIGPFISVDMDFIWGYVKGSNTIDIIIEQDKENMEEKKLNLKPFDIQKAKEGKPVCTRDGRKARVICFDRNSIQPIVALIKNFNEEESVNVFFKDGHSLSKNNEVEADLMMLPEKKEGWINIYSNGNNHRVGSPIYNSKKEALNNKASNVIDTVKIEWEE